MPSNQASAGSSPTRCEYLSGYNLIPSGKAMENHPCEKFPWEHSESSMALEEEDMFLGFFAEIFSVLVPRCLSFITALLENTLLVLKQTYF